MAKIIFTPNIQRQSSAPTLKSPAVLCVRSWRMYSLRNRRRVPTFSMINQGLRKHMAVFADGQMIRYGGTRKRGALTEACLGLLCT
jgi:hypothetical protein